MFGALNTGHEGGCGTLHANAATEVVARFEALGALADMTPAAVRTQLSSALDVVVHLGRHGGVRRVDAIGVFRRLPGGGLEVAPALVADGADEPADPDARDRLAELLDVRVPS